MEASSPVARSRCPNAQDVYWQPWLECSMVRSSSGRLSGWRRMMAMGERVGDEFGAHVLGGGPVDDEPGIGVHDGRAIYLAFRGGVFSDIGDYLGLLIWSPPRA